MELKEGSSHSPRRGGRPVGAQELPARVPSRGRRSRPALQVRRSPQEAPGRRGTSGPMSSCPLSEPAPFPPFRGETRPIPWNWEKAAA